MKMSWKMVNSNYNWEAEITDLEELGLDYTPNRVYQDTSSVKMQNC